MCQDRAQPDDRLDAYLDGLLDDGERLAFERALAHRPGLARQVEMQRAIDAALERALPVPGADALRGVADRAVTAGAETIAGRVGGIPMTRRWMATAASIALLVTGAILIWSAAHARSRGSAYGPLPPVTLAQVYRAEVEGGFQPQVVCRDEAEFSDWFERRFGQGLALDAPEGQAALGLGYANSITSESIHVLARAGTAPIVLFVDRADRDHRPPPVAGDDLHVFRAEIGSLVIYEMSPLDEPRFLAHFRVP